jgi:hypothetical protein
MRIPLLRRLLRNGRARRLSTVPTRTVDDRCEAVTCKAVDNPFASPAGADNVRGLPWTPEELRRCAVPAQDDRTGHLKAGTAVNDARPGLMPVWCPEGHGWFHSICYSTH